MHPPEHGATGSQKVHLTACKKQQLDHPLMTSFRTKKLKSFDEQPCSLLSFSDLKLTSSLVILHTSLRAVSEAAILRKRTSIYKSFTVQVTRSTPQYHRSCFTVKTERKCFLPKSVLYCISPNPTQWATLKIASCKAQKH